MQRPPHLREATKYPATTLLGLAAIGVTLAFWNHWDISPLVINAAAVGREPWRLFTSCLPHVNLPHLAFNLYWVWVFGTFIERAFGPLRYLGVVVLLAAASSAAEWALSRGGIGLSGVGYGLFGMLWALSKSPGFENVVDKRTVNLFVVWFFICVVATYTGIMNVGNVAHGAGAAVGYLLGMCVAAQGQRRQARAAALVCTMVAIGLGATVARPWINLAGPDVYALSTDALAAMHAKDYAKAETLLRQAVKARADVAELWRDLAIALDRQGKTAEAIEAYDRSLALDPSDRELAAYVEQLHAAQSLAAPAPKPDADGAP